ncbi:MAG: Omp28-related outer membrane protein [Saprospiraceae bacterium]|nr:Omp28-related outer membrane protein [Saprospiraceae bacterium]
MKQNLLFSILFFCLGTMLIGQSQRKVLIEHFTQASCGPCASINPVIQPIMERNKAKITKITHQVSWPGVDPMNKDNPGEVQNRVNYYGVTGVPDIFLNAYSSGNPTATITDATIQNEYLRPAPYEISIINKVLPDYNSMEVSVTVKLTGTFSGKPVLRVAALEKIISWTTPPGSNGEKTFYHVVKKYLPNTNGTSLADVNQTGQSKTFTFLYKFDKLYNFQNLETAAFIQDDATKEVHQSENLIVAFPANPGNDVAIKLSNATGVYGDSIVCGNKTSPIVKVINTGNKSITSLDFKYQVNGGAFSNYNWTGKLDFLKEIDIKLPAIDFVALKGQNNLSLEISAVNGDVDINTLNNISNLTFQSAPSTTIHSTFEIKPTTQPTQLSFAIRDDQNKIILQDGPFTDNSSRTYVLDLEKDRCYRVSSTNNTASLNGTYKIFDEQINLIFQQRILGVGTVSRDFSTYSLVTGTNEPFNASVLFLTPNPANQEVFLNFDSEKTGIASLSFMDLTGKQIFEKQINLIAGKNKQAIAIHQLASGVYFARLFQDNQMRSMKFIVN